MWMLREISRLFAMVAFCIGAFGYSVDLRAQSCDGLVEAQLGIADLMPLNSEFHAISDASFEESLQADAKHGRLSYRHARLLVVRDIGAQHNAIADVLGEIEVPPGRYCLRPKAGLLIFFGVERRQIYIPESAASNSCLRDALLAHDQNHVAAEKQAVQSFLRKQGPLAYQALKKAKDTAYPLRGQAAVTFSDVVEKLIAIWEDELISLGNEVLMPRESEQELARLGSTCGRDM